SRTPRPAPASISPRASLNAQGSKSLNGMADRGDRSPGLDPAHAEWTYEKPGDKVGRDQRLPGETGQQAEHPGEQDASGDIAKEFVQGSGLLVPATRWPRRCGQTSNVSLPRSGNFPRHAGR